MREINAIPKDDSEVKLYKGVGKMYVYSLSVGCGLTSRFMMRERDTLDSDNVKMEKTIADDLEQLGKKAKYLEKQFNEANSQLRDIVSLTTTDLHRCDADE